MSAPSFEFGVNGISVLQSRVSILELENAEKKKIEKLEDENKNIRELYRTTYKNFGIAKDTIIKEADEFRIEQLQLLQASNNKKLKMSEEELDKLKSENRDLEEKIAEQDRQYKNLEDVAAGFQKGVTVEKEKVADRDARIKKLLEDETLRETYIKGVEEEAQGFQNRIEQLERVKEHLETLLSQVKEERDAANEAKKVIEQSFLEEQRKTEGVRNDLRAANIDKSRLTEDNAQLLSTVSELQHVQSELAEEQKLTAGLRDQVGRLGDELPRFDLSPKSHLAPAGFDGEPKTPRTLANEFEAFASSHESTADSDASTAKASSEGSSSSSSDDDDDDQDGKTEVIQVLKPVLGPTVYIYTPYQAFAHNPFTCWFLTEFNVIVLFACWFSLAAARTSPRLRRVFRTQNPDTTTPVASHQSPNGAKGASLRTLMDNTASHPTPGPASSASPQNANGTGTSSRPKSTTPANGNPPQSSTVADVANIHGPAPTNNGSASQRLNGAHNTTPTITGTENGSAAPAQNGANATSSPPLSGRNPSSPPKLAVFAAVGSFGDQPSHPSDQPQQSVSARAAQLAKELIPPITPVEDTRPILPFGNNLPRTGANGNGPHFPRIRWWMRYVDPLNPPNAFRTIFAMIIHLIFYYFLWICYSTYIERDLWRAANEATRALLIDILALRSRSGRGLASHIFSEEVVRIIDRFILATISLFNVEINAYPIPG